MRKKKIALLSFSVLILAALGVFIQYQRRIIAYNNGKARLRLLSIISTRGENIDLPVIFINMDRNPGRRRLMEDQLRSVKDVWRIPGVDGTKPAPGMMDGVVYESAYPRLKPTEIGCLLSHVLAVACAYDRGLETCLILEDDCDTSLSVLFHAKLSEICRRAPAGWEILQLHTFEKPPWFWKAAPAPFDEYIPFDHLSPLWSACAYVINRAGMKKIVQATRGSLSSSSSSSSSSPAAEKIKIAGNEPLVTNGGIVEDNTGKECKPTGAKYTLGATDPASGNVFPRNGVADSFVFELATTFVAKKPLFLTFDCGTNIQDRFNMLTRSFLNANVGIIEKYENDYSSFL